jgi:hypothetical protein
MPSVDALLTLLDAHGPLLSSGIQGKLGLSQSSTSRLLLRAGDRVVRIGRGRATRYAAVRDIFDVGREVALFAVGEDGVVVQVATLLAATSGQYIVEAQQAPRWLRGEAGTGVFDSLPYFLHDLRPAGFVGRRIARRLAESLGAPRDPRDWSDAQIGRYLLQHGDDLPGDLVVGQAVAHRVSQRGEPTDVVQASDYPELARRALGDDLVGSSAAGEQPKFIVQHQTAGPVIVKFSPAAQTEEAQRWRDLLRAEAHALALLRDRGLPAAKASIHAIEERVYLQCRRFDRVGARGRRPAVSMTMVDAEFVGEGLGWSRTASGLHRQGLLDRRALEQITWLEVFGAWIGNNDMHLGNISLSPWGEGFGLLPLYDMLPMTFAPVHGELPEVTLQPPVRTALNEAVWASAGAAAVDYWTELSDQEPLSDGFRTLARSYGVRWRSLLGL